LRLNAQRGKSKLVEWDEKEKNEVKDGEFERGGNSRGDEKLKKQLDVMSCYCEGSIWSWGLGKSDFVKRYMADHWHNLGPVLDQQTLTRTGPFRAQLAFWMH
jgi:hypothetical protein